MLAGVLMPDDPARPDDLILTPGTGTLTFTGHVSDILPVPLVHIDAFAPSTGALTFTGNVSSVYAISPLDLAPATGTLTFTGHVSTILIDNVGVGPTLTPTTGALTLTGYPPTVTVRAEAAGSAAGIGDAAAVGIAFAIGVGTAPGTGAAAAVAPTFALTDLANLQALWDADSISGADNSSIGGTAILDSSGNSRNSTALTGTTATLRTAFLNGHNVIRAAGGSYDVPNFISGFTQGTMFWVAKTDTDNSTNSPPWLSNTSAGTAQHYPYLDNHIYMFAGSNTRRDMGAVGSGVLNAWHIVVARVSGSIQEFRVNGSVLFTTGTNTVAFTTTPKFFNAGSGSNFVGHDAVTGFYSTAHSQADCEKIEGYLAHHYRITAVLPGGHPYKTTPP